jgi:hypothetical protein
MLFIIAMDILHRMLAKACDDRVIRSLHQWGIKF